MAVRPIVASVLSRGASLTGVGVALLLAMAAIDLLVYFGFGLAFAYPGTLFLLNAAAAAVLAGSLLRGYEVAWDVAAGFAASTAVLFVIVRTVGLPNFQLNDWVVMLGFLPLGPLSLVMEALFLALYVFWLTGQARSGSSIR